MKTALVTVSTLFLCSCAQEHTQSPQIYRLNSATQHELTVQHTTPIQHKKHFIIHQYDDILKQQGDKRIEINLSTQRGQFFINNQVALDFPVCTGRSGYETPRGRFTIKEKRRHHVSNIYHVSMPCFMRLTYDGIGLHVGDIYRTPASHGCIRLPKHACQSIFNAIKPGTPVLIY